MAEFSARNILFVGLFCVFTLSLSVNAQQSESRDLEAGRKFIQQGAHLLQEADRLNQTSRQYLQQSNQLRRQLLQAQRQSKQTDPDTSLIHQLNTLREQGNSVRLQAQAHHHDAMQQFGKGMQALWPQWVTTDRALSAAPLVREKQELGTQAHNTIQRSVHPGMTDMVPTPAAVSNADMSLALNSPPSQNKPADVDTETFQISRNRHFMGHIEVENSTDNSVHQLPLNHIHQWRLVVCDLTGKAVEQAQIKFLGHMPGHVHGLPTQPQITNEPAPGVYQISGVKFQMLGWWVIDFEIQAGDIKDVLRFNVVL